MRFPVIAAALTSFVFLVGCQAIDEPYNSGYYSGDPNAYAYNQGYGYGYGSAPAYGYGAVPYSTPRYYGPPGYVTPGYYSSPSHTYYQRQNAERRYERTKQHCKYTTNKSFQGKTGYSEKQVDRVYEKCMDKRGY